MNTNIHIINSAQEMFDVLNECVDVLYFDDKTTDEKFHLLNKCRKVLKKARGEA